MSQQPSEGNWRQAGDDDWRRGQGRGQGRGRASDPDVRNDTFVMRHTKGEAPPLHPPAVLGSFSVDSDKNILFDDSMMPVLSREYTPDGEFMEVDIDLKKGCERINKFTGTSAEGHELLLQWILKNQEKVRAKDSSDRLAADFVCSRGILKQIMLTPYTSANHPSGELVMLAKCFKGTIYLVKDPEQENKKKADGFFDIYGEKFERYMTGGDPDEVLECDCQFRCVLQLHFSEMSLMFAPDTDAVDMTRHEDDFKDMNSFVRLKTRSESTPECSVARYGRWWIENKLAGVPRLLMGKRSPEKVVYQLQMVQTDDLPSLAQGKLEPSVYINVLDKFLHFVKRKVLAEPHKLHRFEKSAPQVRHIRHSCHAHQEEDFLPAWYKQNLFATQEEEKNYGGGSS